MENLKLLSDTAVGQSVVVRELRIKGSMRRRLLDMGFCTDAKVECVGKSPSGDPSAYLIRGAVIALRRKDAEEIIVSS